ncbi:MAG: hypothetical protein LBG57_06885 [Treponema sp.]|jgi:uncharacterized membrane protein|nr:hypothetical protein [Treponema sp.]
MNAIFKKKNLFAHILWIVLIVYAVSSVYLLVVSVNWYRHSPGAYLKPLTLVAFAVISFLLVVLVSSYHLSSLIRRRKRRTDRQRLSRARFIRAKHRMAPRGFR